MPTRPWFPFYPADFYADTMQLSLEAQGAYVRLLSHAWRHDGVIPESNAERARILGVHHHKARLLWGVIGGYWIYYPGGYRNPRLDKEMSKVIDISGKRAKAAEKRWDANAHANAHTTTTTVRKKKEIHKERKANGHDPGFTKWWQKYPRKVAKPAAEKAWCKLSLEEREKATQGLTSFTFPEDTKFIPHPATWLNNHRWEDAEVVEKQEVDWQ